MSLRSLMLGGALLPLALAAPADAQETAAAASRLESEGRDDRAASEKDPVSAADIIVNAQLNFRNRTPDPNPVLSYGLEYFQRFEPVSVGEMLKRVPGVTFTSDVLEYDGVQMRGLPAGFTQILINGRRAPGGEADRSFFVDRLPAELVERIEIVRSPRADQPSDGIAGTLNVITKESTAFKGGFAKAGMLINGRDGVIRPSGAVAYADKVGAVSFWGALNYQERRNPKRKVSMRYSDVPSGPRNPSNPDFDNREDQRDTRDGRDLSGNAEVAVDLANGGKLRFSGLFVDTRRKEDETSITREGPDLDFDGIEVQHERIRQKTYALTADGKIPLNDRLELGLAAGWSGYRERTNTTALEGDNEDDLTDLEIDEIERLRIRDDEVTGTASLTWGPKETRVKVGIDLLDKKRRGSDSFDGDPPEGNQAFRIKERRYDPYVRFTYEPSSALTLDAGLRYEMTRRRTTGTDGTATYKSNSLNPSLSLRYAVGDSGLIRASVARTVRRPDYDLISPYEQEEEPGDDDVTIGNPRLRNERAWGVDLGYEQKLGAKGIVGVNFFHRWIRDLVELRRIGDNGDGGVYTARNLDKGRVWGMEVDFSAPLTVIGMPDTGIFANYTYLDSKTRDPFTGRNRRFNNQPHHVYNIGFIQTVRGIDASFGASLSGRSKAVESNFDETVALKYTPDLEVFLEKRLGRNIVLRATASNLLNRSKRETFRKYDGDSLDEILDARRNGDIDEFETERERSGRLFQVTLRAAF